MSTHIVSIKKTHPPAAVQTPDFSFISLYRIAAVAVLLQLLTTLAILVIVVTLGAAPASAQEYFSLMQEDRLAVILQDDFTSLFLIGLYLAVFPGLVAALRRVNFAGAVVAAALTFVGVAVCFATHSGFAMLHLGDQYLAAATGTQRAQILAAGEAVLAANMWNSSGGYMAGILLQGSGILISALMLRSKDFSRWTAYFGILANGLDLTQHLIHPFWPDIAAAILMVAGPFYLAWFPLLARDLFRLGRGASTETAGRERREAPVQPG